MVDERSREEPAEPGVHTKSRRRRASRGSATVYPSAARIAEEVTREETEAALGRAWRRRNRRRRRRTIARFFGNAKVQQGLVIGFCLCLIVAIAAYIAASVSSSATL